jgi:hypothetical protein
MLFLDQSKPNAHLLMKLGLAKKLMARGSLVARSESARSLMDQAVNKPAH